MRILCTGCAGFIGSVVTEYLVDNGHDVAGIDNFQSSYPEAINPKIKFYRGDLESKHFISKVLHQESIELVCHLAAESVIGKSITHPEIFFRGNVINGINLLDAMVENRVTKLVYSSTASIYGEQQTVGIGENHPIEPINAYGVSKAVFEQILEQYWKSYGLGYVAFRYFNVGGATAMNGERRKDETRLIPVVLDAVYNHKPVEIFGIDYPSKDGTAIRDYVHVRDIAQAHILGMDFLNKNPVSREIFNLGSEEGFTVKEIIDKIMEMSGRYTTVVPTKRRLGDPAKLIAVSDHAKEILGWLPQYSNLEQIVIDSIIWYAKPKKWITHEMDN